MLQGVFWLRRPWLFRPVIKFLVFFCSFVVTNSLYFAGVPAAPMPNDLCFYAFMMTEIFDFGMVMSFLRGRNSYLRSAFVLLFAHGVPRPSPYPLVGEHLPLGFPGCQC